ncbi:MAG: guanylate kinase [Tepidiformaceae bacterium]
MSNEELLDTARRYSPELYDYLITGKWDEEKYPPFQYGPDTGRNGVTAHSSPVVIVIHGPSGVGKDTVIDRLRERTNIHRATSTTSRSPRHYEEDGVHYHFVNEDEFERKIEAGDFIEHARVYDQWKGVERREIEDSLARGEDVIIRTDVQGARTWREKLEGAVFVFLMAEDREALRERLLNRGSEDEGSLAVRLAEFEAELADIDNNDYVVINRHGRLDDAIDEIAEIIERERANAGRPAPRLR